MKVNEDRIKIVAAATVIVANWLLAHLATEWVMPSEVQSAFQVIVDVVLISIFVPVKTLRAAFQKTSDPPAPAAPTASPAPAQEPKP